MRTQQLPRAAPARVLAFGAFLKNTACLLDGNTVHWSPLHGDLSTPEACRALDASARALLTTAGGAVDAVAHDLHPDFESTRLAEAMAAELHVPCVPVQHHHAHIGVVQAEIGDRGAPLVGLALDGVGLGSDGIAWGGELLHVQGAEWQRIGHLTPLALAGGDLAAREPWRMAAAALQVLGRGEQIVPRLAPVVGEPLARGVQQMLQRGLICPVTTSAGRWFDAMAGLLGLSVRQAVEAEAAIALERAAAAWLANNPAPEPAPAGLDLRRLAAECLAEADSGRADAVGAAAARFHVGLAAGLAQAAEAAARSSGARQVVLAGGCFYNRVLTQQLTQALEAAGFHVRQPDRHTGPGDAGLALGQAWIAAQQLAGHLCAESNEENAVCA